MRTVQGIKNAQMQNQLMQQDLLNRQAELPNIQQTGENLKLTHDIGSQALAAARMNRARTIMFDLSNRPDSTLAGGDLFRQALDDELTAGSIDKNAHDVALQQIDRITKNGGDKDGSLYRPMLNSAFASTMSPTEQVEFLRGKVQSSTNAAGQTQQVVVPGMGSAPGTQTQNLGTPYGGGLDPAQAADIITLQAPDGTKRQFTRLQVQQYNLLNNGWTIAQPGGSPPAAQPPAQGGPAGAPGGNAPLGGPQPATGGQPTPPTPPSTEKPPPVGGTTAPPAPKSTGVGDIIGKPTPNEGQIALANASRTKDSADMAQLTTKNWNDMQYSLQTAYNMAPKVNTGDGTEVSNYLKRLLTNTMPNVAQTLGIDPNKAIDQQDMFKALARIASSSGNRSDADLFQTIASNPSQHMSPAALQRAAGYVMALNAQESVLTQAAHDQSTHDALDLNTQNPAVRLRIQNGLDPNAFRSPYMEDDEWKKYKDGLSEAGKDRLRKSLLLMKQYLPQPGAGLSPTQGG